MKLAYRHSKNNIHVHARYVQFPYAHFLCEGPDMQMGHPEETTTDQQDSNREGSSVKKVIWTVCKTLL